MNQNELLDMVNASNDYYEVVIVDKVIGEDGQYIEGEGVGYGLLNKITGILEHTSLVLPGVMWQATHFESTMKSLLTEDEGPSLAAVEDIIPSLQ